ncbi:MAG: dynamin family protein, partial [Rhodoferax sp.]
AQVIAGSAPKGLVAKVTSDAELLRMSCLPALEDALGRGMLSKRQHLLGNAMARGVSDLRGEMGRVINIRRRDLTEQMVELRSLQGKNASVIKHMRARIAQEQLEFDLGGAKIHAVRSVHLKLLREVFGILGSTALKTEMTQLTGALMKKGIKLGVKRSYGDTFDRLRASLQQVQTLSGEIQTMLAASFSQLNAEHGFALHAPVQPQVVQYVEDLNVVERSHLQYLGIGNAFKLAQPEFADRLVRALASRLRAIRETALADIELWSKSAAAQLDAQLRERRRSYTRRIEAIDRIAAAAEGLEERTAEIEQQEASLQQLERKLDELTAYLIAAREPQRSAALLEVD